MRVEYQRRLASRLEAARKHEKQFQSLAVARLATAVAGAALVWWNFWLLPVPVAVFVALVVQHERVTRRLALERRGAAWYERALARLDGRWPGTGEAGERFRDPSHPYAGDLDVFGHGSLFQLINLARTAAGEAALAGWLKAPGAPEVVRARQEAIRELAGRLDLREDLALLGEDIRSEMHQDLVARWGGAPAAGVRTWHRVGAAVVSAAMLVAFSGYMLQLWPVRWLLAAILATLAFATVARPLVKRILAAADTPAHDLRILAQVLERFEREPAASPLLSELKQRLATGGLPPSRQVTRLRRLVEYREQARNQMFALIAEPLLWPAHFAFAIERWRETLGPHIAEWIAAVGELEALSSLAGYASEHPSDPFPELETAGPLFEAEELAHPLLPEATVVRNDVHLGADRRLLIVSGSNMSGKSTLLRAVGLNAVLAWAGAPVRARRLRISPLAIGAAMRVEDSVLDGKSRFYAEILRLRQIVDLAGGDPPLLFLLDELLSGTNSHDRRIGSEAVVRGLVAKGAVGLVTTHDLALARIADALAPLAANVHFEDHIEDGRIAFDYRMRPGVVQKSNAIELMRSVGLEV